MMEIVEIVNHLRLNIHNILQAWPALIFMQNGGSVESSILSLLERASLNPWKRETFFSLIPPEDEGESGHQHVISF